MRLLALALAMLIPAVGFGQELTPPPLPPPAEAAPSPPPPPQYVRSCWGNAQTTVQSQGVIIDGNPNVGNLNVGGNGGLPAGSTAAASSADAPLSGVSGGGGGGEGLVVIAVIAAAALPIIVYVVDSDADEEVLFRHGCPSFDFRFTGGVVSTPVMADAWTPLMGVKLGFAQGAFGFDASLESTLDARSFGSADVHLLLRPPPKQHIEGALALGVRRVVFGGAERDGLEVALPHRYAFTRIGTRALGLEVTPAVFLGQRGFDFRLEGGFTLPMGPMSMQLGGRVFTFDSHVRGGAYFGLGANL